MPEEKSDFEAVLPIGYTDAHGGRHRRAFIRKLRGHEEALLYDPAFSAGQLVTELIRGCLVRLGDLPEIDAEVVSGMYTADRNYLLMQIRRITLGNRMATHYACPRCGADVAEIEDLSRLSVHRLAEDQPLDEIVVTLEDGYRDGTGTTHRELALSMPRGVDEEFVSTLAERDPLKAQDALLLRCIRRFGSLPKKTLEAYGVKLLRDLTMGDRQRMQAALNDRAPGMDLQRAVHCKPCGTDFEGVVDVSNFFALG
jgi:hypothetical protein